MNSFDVFTMDNNFSYSLFCTKYKYCIAVGMSFPIIYNNSEDAAKTMDRVICFERIKRGLNSSIKR